MDIHTLWENEYEDFLNLWEKCFGDSRETAEEFLSRMGPDLECFVLTEENEAESIPLSTKTRNSDGNNSQKVRAGLTRFLMGELILPEETNRRPGKIWCSYAICTEPEFRGRGYGSCITKRAADIAEAEGALSVLSPADSGLVDFYRNIGYQPAFYAEERRFTIFDDREGAMGKSFHSAERTAPRPVRIRKADSAEYAVARERLLQNQMHICVTDAVLRYADLCGPAGKGLFLLNEGEGVFSLEDTGDPEILKALEILYPAPEEAARAILSEWKAKEIVYRFPVSRRSLRKGTDLSGGKGSKIFVQAMLYLGEDIGNGWFGYPFE